MSISAADRRPAAATATGANARSVDGRGKIRRRVRAAETGGALDTDDA
jgi:hypothetical protein